MPISTAETDQGASIQRMRRAATTWSVVLFALVVALAGLLVFSISRYEQLQDRLAVKFPVNQAWNSAQLELELERFLTAMLQFGSGTPGMDANQFLERFDVLWSRVDLYKSGRLAEAIANDPSTKATLTGLRALLEEVDHGVATLQPADMPAAIAIAARFAPYLDQVRQMTIVDLRSNLQGQEEQRLLNQDVKRHVLTFVFLFLGAAVLVVVGALRSTWQMHRVLHLTAAARRDAEQSKAQLRQAIESINEGFALFSADERLVLCNQRYREFYPEHAKPLRRRLSPIVDRELGSELAQPAPSEERLDDGRWLLVSDRTTEEGSFVSVRTDISELKWREIELTAATSRLEEQAEQMRMLAEVAEQASRTKSEFLAAMSHEIRTPMTGVLGMADLLAAESMNPTQKRYVDTIRTSGRHLLSIINDILDFSRIESGQLELELIDFALSDALEQVRSLLTPQAAERGLMLRMVQATAPNLTVRGDPTRVRQILVNLVGNGLKFTSQGSVTLTVRQLATTPDAVRLRFEVRDTGIGIPLERQAGLFQPFVQADSSTTRHYGGSGLGLVICKSLVAAMDGLIGLESEPGHGSLFWFELPLLPGNPVAAAQRGNEPAHVRSLRILVVDDVEVNRDLLAEMLGRHEHEVVLAEDGAAALDRAAKERFDVVLMDVQMPVMDGMEATRRIRRLPGSAGAVPVFALTANVMSTERDRYLAAGMNMCLTKPINWRDLFAALAKVASGSVPSAAGTTVLESSATAAEATPDDDPLLNRELLEGMARDIPSAIYRRLLERGLDGALESSNLLQAAVGDRDRLLHLAHRLRGTAGTFGLARIAVLAGQIEERAGRSEDVADLVVKLGQAVQTTRTAVQQFELSA